MCKAYWMERMVTAMAGYGQQVQAIARAQQEVAGRTSGQGRSRQHGEFHQPNFARVRLLVVFFLTPCLRSDPSV